MSFLSFPCCDKCKHSLPKAKDIKDEEYDYPEECQDGWCMWQVCPAGCGHWTIVSIGRWCKAHGHLVAHRSPAAAQEDAKPAETKADPSGNCKSRPPPGILKNKFQESGIQKNKIQELQTGQFRTDLDNACNVNATRDDDNTDNEDDVWTVKCSKKKKRELR